jgi:hypothetical protein
VWAVMAVCGVQLLIANNNKIINKKITENNVGNTYQTNFWFSNYYNTVL